LKASYHSIRELLALLANLAFQILYIIRMIRFNPIAPAILVAPTPAPDHLLNPFGSFLMEEKMYDQKHSGLLQARH